VRRPLAEALDRDELPDGLVVGQLVEAVELERAVEDVLGERAQVGDLRVRETTGAQSLGVIPRSCSGVGAWPPKRSRTRPKIVEAALTDSCWPVIERTSVV